MGLMQKLFGTGAKATVGELGQVIDSLTTSGEERMQFKAQALEAVVAAQAKAIEAEANRGGIAAVWRPITMLSFAAMLWWFVLATTFGFPAPDLSGIPDELWMLMQGGIFGYGSLRTLEKVGTMFDSARLRKKLVKLSAE